MLTYEGTLEQVVADPGARSGLYAQRVIRYMQIGVHELQGLYASEGVLAAMRTGSRARLAIQTALIPGKMILAIEHENGEGARVDRATANRYLGVHLAIWALLTAAAFSLTLSVWTLAIFGVFAAIDAFMILSDYRKIRPV
jgi:hypothetical protein